MLFIKQEPSIYGNPPIKHPEQCGMASIPSSSQILKKMASSNSGFCRKKTNLEPQSAKHRYWKRVVKSRQKSPIPLFTLILAPLHDFVFFAPFFFFSICFVVLL